MTDVSTDVSTHHNAYNHTNVQETETLHTTVLSFFLILTFSALRVGLRLTKKSKLHSVARVVLKLFITITMRILL